MAHPRALIGRLLFVAVLLAAGCSGGDEAGLDRRAGAPSSPSPPASPSTTAPEVDRPRGGVARVAVWEEPDPAAPTLGGAAVRDLVLPQLHEVAPDGSWVPSLMEAGSEEEAPDLGSVSFRLRDDARWSDGSPITAADLRRSADARFVAAVEGSDGSEGSEGPDGSDGDGRVTVRFTQRLPGWRRLWSGVDSVAPPAPGVWGGPFVVAARDPGLEVVLRPNPHWWGTGPFLDEVRLVLVPDHTTTLQLFEEGELDVVAPLAFPARVAQLSAIGGASVDVGPVDATGWWTGLLLAPDGLGEDERRALVATVDRREFVGVFLKEEAVELSTLSASSGAGAAADGGAAAGPWSGVGPGDPAALRDDVVDLVGTTEEPLTGLLQRSMQQRARPIDGVLELRNAEADIVSGWVAAGEYDAAVVVTLDVGEPCWLCRWGAVDEGLARRADAGDAAAVSELQAVLRDRAFVLPLWRPRPVVAWRDGLSGVEVNGFAPSPAWNADQWWRE